MTLSPAHNTVQGFAARLARLAHVLEQYSRVARLAVNCFPHTAHVMANCLRGLRGRLASNRAAALLAAASSSVSPPISPIS